MVSRALAYAPAGQLLGELDWQDVASPLSRTRPIAFPVEPMRRYHLCPEVSELAAGAAAARLQSLGALLDWAYGYLPALDPTCRLRRRAPSAGALYPTEVFAVTHLGGHWRTLYYDFRTRRFLVTPDASAGIASALGLTESDTAVLLVSVLWRSAQRYGARCYRYCLLDAGHVAANLARAAAGFGHATALLPAAPSAELERQLDLRDGEALVCALRLRLEPLPRVPAPPAPGAVPLGAFGGAGPPTLSPILRRIVSFHRRTLNAPGPAVPIEWLCRDDGGFERLAEERRSAAGFTGKPVPRRQVDLLIEAAERAAQASGGEANAGLRAHPVELCGRSAAAVSFAGACQGQQIVEGSAFLVVLAAPVEELLAAGHNGYRAAVLRAGLVCAELYREAARSAVGTTSIGGFSDHAVSRLAGLTDFHPIVVQAFGVEDRSVGKADAARVVPSNIVQPWRGSKQ